MNYSEVDEKNMCFRSMTDDEVILSRIKEGKGLEPLQTPKNKRGKSMRAIDADTLKKTLRDWIRDYWTDDNVGSEFADMIDHAETIEQSSIAHAHWIKGVFADVTCSNCDFHLCIPDSVIPKLAYCPHCGAAMDTSDKSKDKR